jgi:NAD(P)-dependent dehydrogenase (short-subunit alcohol dehydrogenase family)
MGRLDGQSVFLTGGGSGIGRAVVARCLIEGARVAVLELPGPATDALRSDAAAANESLLVIAGDVRSAADQRAGVAATLAAFGGLDVAIANAGIWDFNTALADYRDDATLQAAYTEVLDVNLKGALLTAAAAREALTDAHGSLIFTASSSSSYAGGGGPLYVAAKHGVHGLVRQLAYELAPDVRVNAVAPGATQTPLRGPAALGLETSALEDLQGFRTAVTRQIPLGFVSAAEDHTDLYVLLAARSESRYITGSLLPSDGGLEVRGARRRNSETLAEARP